MNYHLQVLNRKARQAKLLIVKNIPASMFSRHSTSVGGIEHQTCGFRAPKLYHCATETLWLSISLFKEALGSIKYCK